MNTARTGTIDRPLTRDPQKQDPTMNPSFTDTTAPTNVSAIESRQNRNLAMQLMPEALARAHVEQRLSEAESQRRGHRLAAALRARRALAMAVMQ